MDKHIQVAVNSIEDRRKASHLAADGLTRVDVVIILAASVLGLSLLISFGARMRYGDALDACAGRLMVIGEAMMIYANDYCDEYPRAGGPGGAWAARTPDWKAADKQQAYGLDPNGTGGRASISASLYLTIKYAQPTPATFVCKGDSRATVFDPRKYDPSDNKLRRLWDFGPNPPSNGSYAYHMPYGRWKLTTNSGLDMVIAADRNPWMDSPFAKARVFSSFVPDTPPFSGTPAQAQTGDSTLHNGKGQNVVFLDGHVRFAQRPYCGIDNDNIYTSWDGADKVRGIPAKFGSTPADADDSLLVNDPPVP